jgi:hypothetical protein
VEKERVSEPLFDPPPPFAKSLERAPKGNQLRGPRRCVVWVVVVFCGGGGEALARWKTASCSLSAVWSETFSLLC